MCRLCLRKLGRKYPPRRSLDGHTCTGVKNRRGSGLGKAVRQEVRPLGWMGPFKHSTFPWLFAVPQGHTLPSTFLMRTSNCQRHWLTLGSWWKKYHNSIKILWPHSYMVLVDCYGLPRWDTSFICSNSPGSGGKALEKCSKVGCPSKICPLSKSENPWPGKCSMYSNKTGIKWKEAV